MINSKNQMSRLKTKLKIDKLKIIVGLNNNGEWRNKLLPHFYNFPPT